MALSPTGVSRPQWPSLVMTYSSLSHALLCPIWDSHQHYLCPCLCPGIGGLYVPVIVSYCQQTTWCLHHGVLRHCGNEDQANGNNKGCLLLRATVARSRPAALHLLEARGWQESEGSFAVLLCVGMSSLCTYNITYMHIIYTYTTSTQSTMYFHRLSDTEKRGTLRGLGKLDNPQEMGCPVGLLGEQVVSWACGRG